MHILSDTFCWKKNRILYRIFAPLVRWLMRRLRDQQAGLTPDKCLGVRLPVLQAWLPSPLSPLTTSPLHWMQITQTVSSCLHCTICTNTNTVQSANTVIQCWQIHQRSESDSCSPGPFLAQAFHSWYRSLIYMEHISTGLTSAMENIFFGIIFSTCTVNKNNCAVLTVHWCQWLKPTGNKYFQNCSDTNFYWVWVSPLNSLLRKKNSHTCP